MSYSFSVRAATKAQALALAAAEMSKVVAAQASHTTDQAAALAALEAYAAFIEDAEGFDVVLCLNGSLGWRGAWGGDDPVTITSASVGCSAYLLQRGV